MRRYAKRQKKHDCKKSKGNDVIHCFSHNPAPPGYRQLGESAIGQSMYAPDRGGNHNAENHQQQLRELKQQWEKKRARELAKLPTLEQRDRKIRAYQNVLTPSQNKDLLRRGLIQSEINQALNNGWLFATYGGYGITAIDPITGLSCGAQRARDDRSPKYDWAVFKNQNQLKETGENPLFTWVSPNFDPNQAYKVFLTEGALKSLITAIKLWRNDSQIILIGAPAVNLGIRLSIGFYRSMNRLTNMYCYPMPIASMPINKTFTVLTTI
ncbi:MAG: hypothetical protein HC796_09335 [Synechococcaceae cyanobacterium RL_1_2]|nr:hypothetical protein [Synechococcaceae cyanobacterium RL_1_2]